MYLESRTQEVRCSHVTRAHTQILLGLSFLVHKLRVLNDVTFGIPSNPKI